MENLLKELDNLEVESSNIGKEKILAKILKEMPYSEQFFRLVFNDTVYGIEQRTFYSAFPKKTDTDYADVSDWLNTISATETISGDLESLCTFADKVKDMSGGDQIRFIREYFAKLNCLSKKWFSRAILHDLRCGVKVRTYNKVAKKLGLKPVEKFALQLCGKVDLNDDKDVRKRIVFPCYMECKYDGIRLQAEIFTDEGDIRVCKLTSRRGKDRTDKHPKVCEELIRLFPEGYMILDGEIVADSFQKLTRLDDDSERRFIVWDILVDEKLPYISRWDNLVNLFDSLDLGCLTDFKENQIGKGNWNYSSTVILLAEHYTANNIEELRGYYDELNRRGEEGIIIKNLNEDYKRGSRSSMFKCKKVFTADLKIVGWRHGEGKRAGMVSTLCLEDASQSINCDVGSGIDDYWCNKFTDNPDYYVGKICEVKYNEITETGSIRFPRFVTIREDKEEPDNLANG